MKRFKDMTDEEVKVLTNEQLSEIIQKECLMEGIPLLPERPIAPTKKTFKSDMKIYEIRKICTDDIDLLRKIEETLRNSTMYKEVYTSGDISTVKVITPDDKYDYPKIETYDVYSPDFYNEIKEDMKEYEAIKRDYDIKAKEYAHIYNNQLDIREEVMNRYKLIHEKEYEKQSLLNRFKTYLDTAEKDFEVALKFFMQNEANKYKLFTEAEVQQLLIVEYGIM